jgi:hypothetical protein
LHRNSFKAFSDTSSATEARSRANSHVWYHFLIPISEAFPFSIRFRIVQLTGTSPRQRTKLMSHPSAPYKFAVTLAVIASTLLTGCYVMPVQPDGRPYPIPHSQPLPPATLIVPAPGPVVGQVRLYPANDAAAQFGVINGQVLNLLDGRGQFSVTIGNEVVTGEATRLPRSNSGTASASGNRGSYLSCQYTMTNATLGTGTCTLSSGAQFRLHLGG